MTQNYKVGDKVRILDASKIISGASRGLKDGGIYEVVELYKGREYDPIVKLDDGLNFGFMDDDYNYIEKVAEDVAKFKVGDKVRILKTGAISAIIAEEGSVLEVVNVDVDDGTPFLLDIDGESCCTLTSELQYIELVPDKPTKKQRLIDAERSISALETELAELKAKVEALEKAQKPKPITIDFSTKAKESADKLAEQLTQQLTKYIGKPNANEQRKAIIAEAKSFVEDALASVRDKAGDYQLPSGNYVQFDFHVNAEKRTVVVVAKAWHNGEFRGRWVAKCAPDDVFNADIGKAIALGRALGLDAEQISKFEQAVKPTEVIAGMVVKNTGPAGGTYKIVRVDGDDLDIDNRGNYFERHYGVIKDDTEAQY